jgi:hypothetical protein
MDAITTHGPSEASRQLGTPKSTLIDRNETAIKEGMVPSPAALKAAGLKPPKDAPYSESKDKFREDFTAQDCIDELMRLVELNPNKVLSRNFVRVYSCMSESTWNRYFGTFHEFKRQAGVTLSRHQHRHEKDIAKHAAADTMRAMNEEKCRYEGKYAKPNGRRFKTALVGSDIHDKECDPFYRRVFVDAARRIVPDIIVLNGDIFDLPEFSKFTQDPRDWDLIGRISWVHDFLSALRENCPDCEIILVEGNHEFRLLRHLAEATPALRTLLSDLHGFTVSQLLGLDQFEVNLIARTDLAAWTERDIKKELQQNWVNLNDCVIGHHFPEGRQMGYPGWNGHHHRHIVWDGFNPKHGAYEWHQLGCGHRRDATFTNGEKWANGFLTAHLDTEKFGTQFDYTQILDHCVLGGEWYVRQPGEMVISQGPLEV